MESFNKKKFNLRIVSTCTQVAALFETLRRTSLTAILPLSKKKDFLTGLA